jgi:hypothetical protein
MSLLHLCLQLGHYGGMADELDSLKRDKNVLMLELVRLRQQQQVRWLCPWGMHMFAISRGWLAGW